MADEFTDRRRNTKPDYVVTNDPAELLRGRDQQLEKAIEVIQERIAAEPRRLTDRPPGPVKARARRGKTISD